MYSSVPQTQARQQPYYPPQYPPQQQPLRYIPPGGGVRFDGGNQSPGNYGVAQHWGGSGLSGLGGTVAYRADSDSVLRADSPLVSAFSRELEYQEAQLIPYQYPEYKAAEGQLFPIEELNVPWAINSRFTMVDGVGDFELASDRTSNLPFVDATAEEFLQKIFTWRSGYYFTHKEVLAFAHKGQQLEPIKIGLVRQSYQQTLNKLMLVGDKQTGTPGFLNHWAWLNTYAPYKLDTSSTPEQKLLTLNQGVNVVTASTEDVHSPTTLLLSKRRYDYLTSSVRIDPTLPDNLLEYFLKHNPSVRDVDWLRELEDIGGPGVDGAMFYTRNPMNFKARITAPLEFRQLMVYPYEVYRPVNFDYNGLIVYQPKSVHMMMNV